MELSPAFTGCSEAYVAIHLQGSRCLDDRSHDGTPCLLNDPTREAEARYLLMNVPAAARGEGVVLGPGGRPLLRSDQAQRKAS